MRILQTNYQQQTNFKSTYPVVHRIMTRSGSFIPVSDIKTVKILQSKIIRTLNSSWAKMINKLDKEALENVRKWTQAGNLENIQSELKLPKTENEALAIFRGRMGFYDLDYAFAPKPKLKNGEKKSNINAEQRVRSFYNKEKSLIDGRYYLTYMITGKDIKPFEDDLAKNIGKTKHESISTTKHPYSQEAKDAIDLYNKNGLDFVNDKEYRLKSKTTGMTYILRTNFQAVLNKKGEVKDYKFISAKFVPEYSK